MTEDQDTLRMIAEAEKIVREHNARQKEAKRPINILLNKIGRNRFLGSSNLIYQYGAALVITVGMLGLTIWTNGTPNSPSRDNLAEPNFLGLTTDCEIYNPQDQLKADCYQKRMDWQVGIRTLVVVSTPTAAATPGMDIKTGIETLSNPAKFLAARS